MRGAAFARYSCTQILRSPDQNSNDHYHIIIIALTRELSLSILSSPLSKRALLSPLSERATKEERGVAERFE